MKWTLKTICAIAAIFLLHLDLLAWDGAGHMAIAAEAYRQLSPELKAQAVEVLKAHPDYQQWVAAYDPNPTVDLPAYIFMRSSTWPDEIRHGGSPYAHPEWHFIDYPLKPPLFPFEPDPSPTNDVLFGVAQCERTLSDTHISPELRAVYLSYLIHLIGDMHQPLHCECFFDAQFPNGDRGGNDFYVTLDQRAVRLHSIWDGLLGTVQDPVAQWQYSLQMEAEYPRTSLPELSTDTTPKSWTLESRKLAIKYGYLNGRLRGSADIDAAPSLPGDYFKNADAVAERQGALAACRLADEIKEYLKVGETIALPPDANATAAALPQEIGAADAANHYDENMVVTGTVVQVSIRPSVALLDLDKRFPDTPMTIVIFHENLSKFDDLHKYKGHQVTVTGVIKEYRDKPEMVLESPRQIQLVDPEQ